MAIGYNDDEDVAQGLQNTGTMASTAASGALTGFSVAGVPGALIGGAIGLGAGAVRAGEQEAQALEARKQQEALDAALNDTNLLQLALQDQAMQAQAQKTQNVQTAQQVAVSAGLSPGDTARIVNEAAIQSDRLAQQQLPQTIIAARQAEEQRKAGILQQFGVAQELANNAAPDALSDAYANAAAAASMYAASQKVQQPAGFEKAGEPVKGESAFTKEFNTPDANGAYTPIQQRTPGARGVPEYRVNEPPLSGVDLTQSSPPVEEDYVRMDRNDPFSPLVPPNQSNYSPENLTIDDITELPVAPQGFMYSKNSNGDIILKRTAEISSDELLRSLE